MQKFIEMTADELRAFEKRKRDRRLRYKKERKEAKAEDGSATVARVADGL